MRSTIGCRRERRGLAPAGLTLLALSCQTLLGVEELSTTPREDSLEPVGSAGSDGRGPTGAAGGVAAPGLPAGLDAPGGGGAPGNDVGSGDGADAGTALAPSDAATPDAGATTGIVVHGRVIDFHRRPVPDVPVSIGEQTATSDADGRFEIARVSPPYDVSLLLDFARDGVPARYGYIYQDLTRSDPTLQVYSALPQRDVSELEVTLDIANFEDDPDRGVIFAFGSADTGFADGALGNGTTSILGGLGWSGPVSTTGNAHALLVSRPGGVEGATPFVYEAHQTTPLVASDGALAAVELQIQPGGLAAGTVAGNVSGDTLGDRQNLVALRFADGTALPLVEESPPGEAFAYLVPNLPDTSFTVAASQGFVTPFAIVWRDVALGEAGLALALPSPVRLGAPQPDTTLSPGARFSWSRPSGASRTFLWHVEIENDFAYQGVFVATGRTEIELPTFADGFTVPAGSGATWSVETHGDLPDVDAMTGPEGFLDAFSIPPQSFPLGPRRGGGAYTESVRSFFTMDGG